MNNTFANLGIRAEMAHVLLKQGIEHPTPVQEQAIPLLLLGSDVIAQAQTGTGKTLAFVLPILERIDPRLPDVQALIITPTRELAIQITAELKKLVSAVGAHVLPVYGGQDVEAEIRKLNRAAQVVVATPGRLLDHLRRETIRLSQVSMLVLDEADQMLHLGFLPEVDAIIQQLPAKRQTMLFSATMPSAVRRLASRYMNDPHNIHFQGKKVTLDAIHQVVVETTDRAKQQTLFHLIETYRPYLTIAFCRTKIRAKKLNEALLAHGFNADELHGDLSQSKREQVMDRFRKAKLQILVATDVAARGLDVEGITHVFNYDIPHDAESYIHRIGRTGRAAQEGMALTLVAPKDRIFLQQIEKAIGTTLERLVVERASSTADSRKGSVERDGSRKGSVERGGSRRGASERDGSRKGSVERDGSRKGSVERGGSRRGVNERDGSRKGVSERDGSRKGSVERGGSRKSTVERGSSHKSASGRKNRGQTSTGGRRNANRGRNKRR